MRVLAERQWRYEKQVINLIASDNATPFHDALYPGQIIQEGLLGDRPFAGAAIHDEIEALASAIACRVFAADHANLQPHSCSQANQAAYHAVLQPGQPALALDFRGGGHLTHGLKSNFSGRNFRFSHFGVVDGQIDYDRCHELAQALRPPLIVCGSSSYPLQYDIARLRVIADSVGARLMLDLSHEAGLIAGGALPNVIPQADIVTMSLDKTLRGPYGGLILCRKELALAIDRAIHPGTQSSFPIAKLVHAARCLCETQTPVFREYAKRTIDAAQVLVRIFADVAGLVVTGGTDKHYLVLDVRGALAMSGREAERRLEAINILTSRQVLPNDASARSNEAGGLRIGTAWTSSRGYELNEFAELGLIIKAALTQPPTTSTVHEQRGSVARLVGRLRRNDVWSCHVAS
jgi:glycine hydroxymethyltransferase